MRTKPTWQSSVKFCRFPEDTERHICWVRAISRTNWELKDHHCLCSAHFVSVRPSKDANDVDYVPTVFSDKKKRIRTKITPGCTERQAKRAKFVEELFEAATTLIQLQEAKGSMSFKDNSNCVEGESQQDQHETSTEYENRMLKEQNQYLLQKVEELQKI